MKYSLFLAAFVILALGAHAQLYADVTFDVHDAGDVRITGQSNYQPFHGFTNNLTSKKGSHWVLNITGPEFEEFVYHIELPSGASVNYIKASTDFRITGNNRIVIIGTGSNKTMSVLVQYSIGQTDYTLWIVLGVAAVLIIGGIAYIFLGRKRPVRKEAKAGKESTIKRHLYSERQLQIIDYLSEHGVVTQAELEKALRLPKSSLSRNIDTLVKKEVIFREQRGMSNVVGLKD